MAGRAWGATLRIVVLIGAVGVCGAAYGYTLEETGTGFAEVVRDGTYLSSPAAVRMGTVDTDDRSAIVFDGGYQLNSLGSLSYWTYPIQLGTFGQLAPWISIYLHPEPGKTMDDWTADYLDADPDDAYYLQAEPYYKNSTNPTPNVWEEQDAFGGTPLKWLSLTSPDYPHEAPPLASYIDGGAMAYATTSHGVQAFATREYGTLYVVAIKIRMGYGGPWADTLAYVDDANIDGVVAAFDETLPTDIPAASGWGLAALALTLLVAGVFLVRR